MNRSSTVVNRWVFSRMSASLLPVRDTSTGSENSSANGISTLYPALHRGWTDDVYAPSVRAARATQRALVRATGARDLGIVPRSDLTGFNWADVPAILVETGFMSNRREGQLLRTPAYQQRVARGLVAGVSAFVGT